MRIIENVWSLIVGPALVVGSAIWLFRFLRERVVRGRISRLRAFILYLFTMLLPLLFFGVLVLLADLANEFYPGSVYNGDSALAAYYWTALLFLVAAIFNVAFWVAISGSRDITSAGANHSADSAT